MKIFDISLVVILLSLLISCNNDDDYKIMTLTIAAHKVKYNPPYGESDIMAYAVTDSDNNEFVINYIHNFEDKYEEGYKYVIKVKAVEKNKGKKPIEDVFGYSYYLLDIISKEKVETE